MVDDKSRLVRLEQSVMGLWERVEAAGRWAEQRHVEVMKLYTEVLQGGRGEAWLMGLMEQQLQRFRTLHQKRQQVRPLPHVKGLEFYIESLKTIILPRSCITGRVEPRGWTGWSCSCRRWQHRPKYGWVTRAPLEFCP